MKYAFCAHTRGVSDSKTDRLNKTKSKHVRAIIIWIPSSFIHFFPRSHHRRKAATIASLKMVWRIPPQAVLRLLAATACPPKVSFTWGNRKKSTSTKFSKNGVISRRWMSPTANQSPATAVI